MACILDGSKLTLSGTVGDDWWGDAFTYEDVLLALAAVDDASDLTVHINSGGGGATEGAAINALLAARTGRTDVVVEGIAASAASLIAMAGETVSMADGAVMMIHDPAGFTMGTSADHAKQIEALEALATAYARVYAAKSGKTTDEAREVMKAERWYAADEAIAEGFADAKIERPAAAVAMFDYQQYAHAPRKLRAQAKNWLKANPQAARSAAPGQKETKMTDKTPADAKPADQPDVAKAQADAVKADRERRAAIMALDEAKGREALAEHLYASTEMSVDAVKATLSAASATEKPQPDAAKLATAGLGGGAPGGQPQMRVDIVAAARKRAGL
ncbi:prophage Clp protease-like protein [Paracoccus yeei]|uniref:ATP-dependent Clp protease proteolytic subunit n=1 Tax=Paracoccus yeei TaxID=147645 RepID=A0A386UIE9_9RHOB|nr:head maturation protease, ClpP-related [Paracoccus yeei]AYF00447.1 prophage Clp protease-like protein [Paracoccus yeei]AZV00453.1 Clp protease protein [Paracoccus phage vB_PyeM_Pyei1]